MSKNDNEPLSSPYFPDIPDLIAQGAAEDTSKNYDASATDSTATGMKHVSIVYSNDHVTNKKCKSRLSGLSGPYYELAIK